MRKNLILIFIFALVVILCLRIIVTKPLISNIKNTKIFVGCGCSFQLESQRQGNSDSCIFYSAYPEEEAWVNIDGKDTQLKLVSATGNSKDLKKGNKSTRKYEADNVSAIVDRVITSVCSPSPQDCRYTAYAANITVKKLNRQQTVKATGGCAC